MQTKGFVTLLFWVVAIFGLSAQQLFVEGIPYREEVKSESLTRQFKDFTIFQVNPQPLVEFARNHPFAPIQLQLGRAYSWTIEIFPNKTISKDYVMRIWDGEKMTESRIDEQRTFQGHISNETNSDVRLTLDDNFIYGFFERADEALVFIEPLSFFVKDAPTDLFVVYKETDVKDPEHANCGVGDMHRKSEDIKKQGQIKDGKGQPEVGNCYELDLAIASDFLMYVKYGSVANVENHTIGVMNNVQTNYDDEFADEIQFVIVEQFVSTCSSCDPWTSSTNPNTLLSSFTNWGPNGFNQVHDLGQLWTDRDLNGGVVGIAWLSAVCTNNRYHVLQDFTNNASLMRMTTAHEIGHNFSGIHDSGPLIWIMSPTVNNTNDWSTLSINTLNGYIANLANQGGCFASCGVALPPVANFSALHTDLCLGSQVQFYDLSENDPTSWNWTFPGGSPSGSTEQNPLVTYNVPGTYSVTLTATNATGSDIVTFNSYITIGAAGEEMILFEDFEGSLGTFTVENPNSDNTWEYFVAQGTRFGTGVAKMENFSAGTSSIGRKDALVSPEFSMLGHEIARLEIDYAYARYNSSRRDSLNIFLSTDGGNTFPFKLFGDTENGNGNFATAPAQTTAFNPTSQDDWCLTGSFGNDCLSIDISAYGGEENVVIKLENVGGNGNNMYIDNVRILASCEIPAPIAAFQGSPNLGCVPMTVNFDDLSTGNPSSWEWQFPGGTPASSMEQFPIIVYNLPGTYDVTMTASNVGGSSTSVIPNYITVIDEPTAAFSYTEADAVVTFTNQSTGATQYLWDFGDGTNSTMVNPIHTYPGDGVYTVTLTATNDCGTTIFQEIITIITPPIAAFSADQLFGCTPMVVQFIDESSPNTTAWQWSFPGGSPSSSTEQNPLVTYNQPGNYDVTLTVINGAGSNTFTEQGYITVINPPIAGFSYNDNGNTVDFVNESDNAESYLWDFGDGQGSSDVNPSHSYVADGNYTVTLISTSTFCGNDTTSAVILIENQPQAGFTANVNEGCEPLSVGFVNTSSANADSLSWFFPGGNPLSSSEENPQVLYNAAGTYDVILIAINATGSDTLVETAYITVNPNPIAAFSVSIDGWEASFTNNSQNADSVEWYFGDGNESAENDPVHQFNADGIYTVMLISKNGCGADTMIDQITVLTLPTADFSADQSTGCVPLTVHFQNESSANTDSLLWFFPGGNPSFSNDSMPVVVYENPGLFNVTLIVFNALGADTMIRLDYIETETRPDAGFSVSIDGLEVAFVNNSSNADTYDWDFGNGVQSAATDTTIFYDNEGLYTVTMVATNNCGQDTAVTDIQLTLTPVAGFSSDVKEACPGAAIQFENQTSGTVDAYLWLFPGGMPSSSTVQNPTVTYSEPGVYDVTLIASNGVGSDTLQLSNYITILPLPSAGFSTTVNVETVTFQNESANASVYFWNFGDGGESTDSDPEHTYAAPGTYEVVLIAQSPCGADTTSSLLEIIFPPIADISADLTTGCPGLTVQFSGDNSTDATAWNWIFPGGIPANSTEENPTVTYDFTGIYDVTLIVTNSVGNDTLNLQQFITVLETPTASFDYDVNGGTVVFQNNSADAQTYHWDFGDNNVSDQTDPVHNYQMDGTYTATLIATGNCGSDTIAANLEILLPPVAGFSSNLTTACPGTTITFTDQSTGVVEMWTWTFPGGQPATSTEQNPLVVYDSAGLYNVTLVVTNAEGSDTLTWPTYITIIESPIAAFSVATSGLEATFTNNSEAASNWYWDFGDGNEDTTFAPVHEFTADGTYEVLLIATGACGADSASQLVTIQTPPTGGFSSSPATICPGETIQFDNQSSSNATGYSWFFPGGFPETSMEENPSVTYFNEGVYDVILIVENAAGSDTIQALAYVEVLPLPFSQFNTIINGQEVTFNNLSSNAESYSWTFGDGAGSNEENPVHTYDQGGVYVVELVAINSCDTAISSAFLTIVDPPIASFKANSTSGCAPYPIQFVDLSQGVVDFWYWEFPGGNPASSTEQNPVVIYENQGIFPVTLIVTNASGSDTLSQQNYVNISDLPLPEFSFSTNGLVATFTNESMGAASYTWNFGDASGSSVENPQHTYDQAGTYVVSLTAFNDCGTVTTTDTVEVAVPPNALFELDIDSFVCVPIIIQATDLSTNNPTDWLWTLDGPEQYSSTQQNPMFVINTSGSYVITLEASNAVGSTTYFLSFDAGQAPIADFNASANGLEVQFEDASLDAVSYSWSFGDGNQSDEASPIHLYDDYGNYDVVMVVKNSCGTDTAETTVVLEKPIFVPIAGFSSDLIGGCPPLEVHFSDTSANEPTAWKWIFSGGIPDSSTEQNPVVLYQSEGVYDVQLIVTNAAGSDTVYQQGYIRVDSLPHASFTWTLQDAQVTFENTSEQSNTYFWDFGDNEESTEENPVHEYDMSGDYSVMLVASNDCGADSVINEIEVVIISTQQPSYLNKFSLYPNPGNGLVFLEMAGEAKESLQVSLYDLMGRMLFNKMVPFQTGALKTSFDWTHLPAATYILELAAGSEKNQWKIIIER